MNEVSEKKRITIVSGCFNEADNIKEFVSQVTAVIEKLPAYTWDILIIDNASTDGTQDLLRELAARDRRIKVILNARNFGVVRSSFHALCEVDADAMISLVSDLQDPPEMIPALIEKWEEGYKAVVGVKKASEESPVFFAIRKAYYRLVYRLSDTEIIQNFTGFGLFDKAILQYCRSLRDPYPYFRGIISEIGLPIARIVYNQPARKRGFTKHNFYSLYDLAMLGITSHSKVPLRLAAMAGFAMSFLSLLVGILYLIYKLLFWNDFSVGVAPVVIGLFLFSSVQLFFIGIIGEYVGAIHTLVLKRPLVVEKERLNFPSSQN